MRSLIVGKVREIREGERKTTFWFTAAMDWKECWNEFIRCSRVATNTSKVGNKGGSSAVWKEKSGLADVVSISVCPSKNPGRRFHHLHCWPSLRRRSSRLDLRLLLTVHSPLPLLLLPGRHQYPPPRLLLQQRLPCCGTFP